MCWLIKQEGGFTAGGEILPRERLRRDWETWIEILGAGFSRTQAQWPQPLESKQEDRRSLLSVLSLCDSIKEILERETEGCWEARRLDNRCEKERNCQRTQTE